MTAISTVCQAACSVDIKTRSTDVQNTSWEISLFPYYIILFHIISKGINILWKYLVELSHFASAKQANFYSSQFLF